MTPSWEVEEGERWNRRFQQRINRNLPVKAQIRQMLELATQENLQCERCGATHNATHHHYRAKLDTSGSNQFRLRLKCGKCKTVLAIP